MSRKENMGSDYLSNNMYMLCLFDVGVSSDTRHRNHATLQFIPSNPFSCVAIPLYIAIHFILRNRFHSYTRLTEPRCSIHPHIRRSFPPQRLHYLELHGPSRGAHAQREWNVSWKVFISHISVSTCMQLCRSFFPNAGFFKKKCSSCVSYAVVA